MVVRAAGAAAQRPPSCPNVSSWGTQITACHQSMTSSPSGKPSRCSSLSLTLLVAASGIAGGSEQLKRQIEELTCDLSAFSCQFFRVEVTQKRLPVP